MCLHGIGSCADAFEPQFPLADRTGHRLVAWDAPGYRHSADPASAPGVDGWADAAAEVIGGLGVDSVDLLGVSWGGVISTRLTLRHPGLVRSLVLADSSVGSGTEPHIADAMRSRASAVDELGLDEFARRRSPMLLTQGAPRALVDDVARLMVDSVRMPSYQWAVDAMADTDHTSRLGEIRCPTLVVVGADDRVTPPKLSDRLVQGISGAELAVIPAAGHLANQERPDDFNAVVADFLEHL
jgi:pimeloyl-ACP methyl ester carboxylesterase